MVEGVIVSPNLGPVRASLMHPLRSQSKTYWWSVYMIGLMFCIYTEDIYKQILNTGEM